ncbi:hypothetical protein WH50_11425 [Pokkaliibacter plantistimulans]|uniref:Uncharacterized protein n=1 Tax=Pokkaliibacter plantistimulans TaxID=1635171 RepID=A0ABX5LWU1_9GAMM|nr:hypothetical protein [Pokkaliibacter plantistimulans]PXF31132.1 hypothetical protein WH50_11425 [Pokkaliibacter plantistimulans]
MSFLINTLLAACLLLTGAVSCSQANSDYPEPLPGYTKTKPEDQGIMGPFHITEEWQTFKFNKPMQINRIGIQNIHIGLNSDKYSSSDYWHLYHTPGFNAGDPLPKEKYRGNGIRDRSTGILIEPDIELLGDNNSVVTLSLAGSQYWPTGATSIICGILPADLTNLTPIYYPEKIKVFTAFRIRSNQSFDVDYFLWRMDHYPGQH